MRFQETFDLDNTLFGKIKFYLKRKSFANNKYFQELQELLPSPAVDKSLAILNPSLASKQHPTKNGTLTPEDVTPKSGAKVWWRCKKGHEWDDAIQKRSRSAGCPYCINRRVCKDNCLATVNPKLASEWHPTKNSKLTLEDVVLGSHKQVWWQDCLGREQQEVIWYRVSKKRKRNKANRYQLRLFGE